MILMISSADVLREYLLPKGDGMDYKIVLSKDYYHLKKDIVLKLEITGGIWYVKESRNYKVTGSEKGFGHIRINPKDIISFSSNEGEKFNAVATDSEEHFVIYNKYNIASVDQITIGSSEENDISYSFMKLVSHKNAVIEKKGSWMLKDVSTNGTFLNSNRIQGTAYLRFGDEIDIFGLKIVFLGNIIAVGTHYGDIKVKKLQKLTFTRGSAKQSEKKATDDYFHRSPRNLPVIYNEKIKIEQAPEPKRTKKKSLLMQIGPSFTMAIPMTLGCGLAIYSSNMSGSGTGAFMYTGIITAVGSAFLGAMWAVMNMRAEKKDEAENERLRFTEYGDYLVGISNALRDKYIHNKSALEEMYPSAEQVCKYSAHDPMLWNRNVGHGDFMYYRLGLGNIPFQVTVGIPEERFSIYKDFLREKPKMLLNEYRELEQVPIGVDLRKNRLIGIIGGNKLLGAIQVMHILTAAIAASNCYTDVKMIFVYDGSKADKSQWEFSRWLPHVWSENRKTRFIASNSNEMSDIFYELATVIRQREENLSSRDKKETKMTQYVMFVSDAQLLTNQMISKYVYHPRDEYGLTTLIMAERYEKLPNECEFIIEYTERFQGFYNTMDSSNSGTHVNFDRVDQVALSNFAKRISELRVNEFESDNVLPSALEFFEMYGARSLEDFNILDQWYKNRTYNSMKALIGKKAGGENCYLDIHEKFHGPHGLVAGTTGSGKSETLQTFILSLAINYSPEDIAFFIIDFKGSGMSNLFSDLPHMAGEISNLSGNKIHRAMISIKSENRRRQRIFGEYGVNNINLYTRLYKSKEAKLPVPHLIIIIDEFAELRREEPEFIRELISVAQVGRSLGVHLILATQKPSGTVDDNIRSNSRFHLCLRVQDRQDSNDMLGKPDAAYITQAGRCYLQVGNDELYELFQSGWSGATYDRNMSDMGKSTASMITLTGKPAIYGSRTKMKRMEKEKISWFTSIIGLVDYVKNEMPDEKEFDELNDTEILGISDAVNVILTQRYDYGKSEADKRAVENFVRLYAKGVIKNGSEAFAYSQMKKSSDDRLPEIKEKTQLEVLVQYLKKLAADNHFDYRLRLWLPVLPSLLEYEVVTKNTKMRYIGGEWSEKETDTFTLSSVVGMYDDPENQLQMPVSVNFAANGSLAVCGAVVSGKSTFLQTMIYGLINSYTPEELNFYIFDFSGHILMCYEDLPHTGGYLTENDSDKIAKFFTMADKILQKRKKLLGGGNYSEYLRAASRTSSTCPLAAILIVIDNIGAFRDKTGGVYDSMLIRLAKEGISCGIYLAVSAGGIGMSELPTQLAGSITNTICLNMGDKYKYLELLKSSHLGVMPESGIRGRGLARIGDRILEFQTAVSVAAPDDYSRTESLKALSEEMSKKWKGRRAEEIPFIPEKPTLDDLKRAEGFNEAIQSRNLVPIGYIEEDASLECIDLFGTYCYTITGRQHTGKTNVLKLIMNNIRKENAHIAVIEKSKNELKQLTEQIGGKYIETDKDLYDFLGEIKKPFIERNKLKHGMMDKGMDDLAIFEEMQKKDPYFIIVASLEEFFQMVYRPESGIGRMNPFVENIIDKGELHNIYFFGTFNPDNHVSLVSMGAYKSFVGKKKGLHLGGCLDRQKIFTASNISYSEQSKSQPKGVAYVTRSDDDTVMKKVILPRI